MPGSRNLNPDEFRIFPPKGYYSSRRPIGTHPSAKPLDFYLDRLSAATGGQASYHEDEFSHSIHIRHPRVRGMSLTPESYLSWSKWNIPSSFQIVGLKHRPGEILMVSSAVKGTGKLLHDSARAIARADPGIAPPRHSMSRTDAGEHWVPQEQRRYGEGQWGPPPPGHPLRPIFEQKQAIAQRIGAQRAQAQVQVQYGSPDLSGIWLPPDPGSPPGT